MNRLGMLLSLIAIFAAAAATADDAKAPSTAPASPPAAQQAAAQVAVTKRLQAVIYEVRVAPDSIAKLDAAKLARETDFAKALNDLGKTRVLYAFDQRVNLAGDKLIAGSSEPMVTSSSVTETGRRMNTLQYQDLGAIITIKPPAAAPGDLNVDSDIQVSARTDSVAKVAEGAPSAPATRKFTMSLKGPVDLGTPVVVLAADAASRDADGQAVVCVCRAVLGAKEQ